MGRKRFLSSPLFFLAEPEKNVNLGGRGVWGRKDPLLKRGGEGGGGGGSLFPLKKAQLQGERKKRTRKQEQCKKVIVTVSSDGDRYTRHRTWPQICEQNINNKNLGHSMTSTPSDILGAKRKEMLISSADKTTGRWSGQGKKRRRRRKKIR